MAVKEPWNVYLGYPVNCACETGDTVVNSIESLGDKLAIWANIIGNSIEYTYDGNGNVTQSEYYTGATLMFTQIFTYDVDNNVIKIETI